MGGGYYAAILRVRYKFVVQTNVSNRYDITVCSYAEGTVICCIVLTKFSSGVCVKTDDLIRVNTVNRNVRSSAWDKTVFVVAGLARANADVVVLIDWRVACNAENLRHSAPRLLGLAIDLHGPNPD